MIAFCFFAYTNPMLILFMLRGVLFFVQFLRISHLIFHISSFILVACCSLVCIFQLFVFCCKWCIIRSLVSQVSSVGMPCFLYSSASEFLISFLPRLVRCFVLRTGAWTLLAVGIQFFVFPAHVARTSVWDLLAHSAWQFWLLLRYPCLGRFFALHPPNLSRYD